MAVVVVVWAPPVLCARWEGGLLALSNAIATRSISGRWWGPMVGASAGALLSVFSFFVCAWCKAAHALAALLHPPR